MAGELDNRTPGKVTGWTRFFRNGKRPLKVVFDFVGDFHEDIRGKVIKLSNPNPSDKYQNDDEGKTFMDGFCPVQRGTVGDCSWCSQNGSKRGHSTRNPAEGHRGDLAADV